jgi:hypothetical protein
MKNYGYKINQNIERFNNSDLNYYKSYGQGEGDDAVYKDPFWTNLLQVMASIGLVLFLVVWLFGLEALRVLVLPLMPLGLIGIGVIVSKCFGGE